MSIRKVIPIEQTEWSIGPRPEWALEREVDFKFTATPEAGMAVLLTDEQQHTVSQAGYYRSVRRLLTLSAVQALGQAELEFDPAAHRLVVHELAIWRLGIGGVWSKRSLAERETFLLRQREQQLEQQMLNGRVSLVALLEDLRVGDAIELEWSLEPREILPGLRFSSYFAFSWTVPVGVAFFCLYEPGGNFPPYRLHRPEKGPELVINQEANRITWSVENPPLMQLEPNVPGSHWPFTLLEASSWGSWAEVAQFVEGAWAEALEQGAATIAAEVERLREFAQTGGPEGAAREAIRFVQEDVRYLVVDFGHAGGILPNGAGVVIRRRFGDCKDKTVLLIALLRGLGFEAWPVLVASGWRNALLRVLPSANAFSHAIVGFRLGERELTVDPTVVGQGGKLAELVEPPFGCGLLIRPGTTGLTTLPELPPAELLLIENFHLDSRGEGSVEQELRATSWMADEVRGALRRNGEGSFSKMRLEALQRHFPTLKSREQPAVVTDQLEANSIEWRVSHALPSWGPLNEKSPDLFRYGAHGLFLGIEIIEGPEERTQPWALRYPLSVRHRVIVKGKGVQKIVHERHEHRGPGFHYLCTVTGKKREVIFDYHWQILEREVAPNQWRAYLDARNKALDRAGANVMTVGSWRSKSGLGPAIGIGVAAVVMILSFLDQSENQRNTTVFSTPRPRTGSQILGAREEAPARVDLFANLNPGADSKAQSAQVMALLKDHRGTQALEIARAAVKQSPSAQNWHAYAAAAASQREFFEAESAFSEWGRLEPASAEYLSEFGWFLASSGRPTESLRYFEKAVKQAPRAGPIWLNYAKVLESLNRPNAGEVRLLGESLLSRSEKEALSR